MDLVMHICRASRIATKSQHCCGLSRLLLTLVQAHQSAPVPCLHKTPSPLAQRPTSHAEAQTARGGRGITSARAHSWADAPGMTSQNQAWLTSCSLPWKLNNQAQCSLFCSPHQVPKWGLQPGGMLLQGPDWYLAVTRVLKRIKERVFYDFIEIYERETSLTVREVRGKQMGFSFSRKWVLDSC